MKKHKLIKPGYSTKMRIQFFDKKTGLMTRDRLVEQSTELNTGPKSGYSGPIALEVSLLSQKQTELFIEYLKRLKGDLPLMAPGEKKVANTHKIDKMLSEKEPLMDLFNTIKRKCADQESVIKSLREYDFRFISGSVIEDMRQFSDKVKSQITLRPDESKEYQYMVRLIKQAVDPMNDKYDFRLVYGIKIVGKKINKIVVYLWGKFEEEWELPWRKPKENNFKKAETVYIFPEFMDYGDRKKWRMEHRRVERAKLKGEQYEPSNFYTKFAPYVQGI